MRTEIGVYTTLLHTLKQVLNKETKSYFIVFPNHTCNFHLVFYLQTGNLIIFILQAEQSLIN